MKKLHARKLPESLIQKDSTSNILPDPACSDKKMNVKISKKLVHRG
jgi:hypothetical protein